MAWKNSLATHLAGLLLLTIALFLLMYGAQRISGLQSTVPLISLYCEAFFDLIIAATAFRLLSHFSQLIRLFFLLIAIECTIRAIGALLLIEYLSAGGSTTLYQTQLSTVVHNMLIALSPVHWLGFVIFIFKPFYWTVFTVFSYMQSRGKAKMLIPSIPTAITILLTLIYLLWYHYSIPQPHKITGHPLTGAAYDMLLCLFILYCIPITKNKNITILIVSAVVMVSSDLLAPHSSLFIPYYHTVTISHAFWLAGNLLLIYSLLNF